MELSWRIKTRKICAANLHFGYFVVLFRHILGHVEIFWDLFGGSKLDPVVWRCVWGWEISLAMAVTNSTTQSSNARQFNPILF